MHRLAEIDHLISNIVGTRGEILKKIAELISSIYMNLSVNLQIMSPLSQLSKN